MEENREPVKIKICGLMTLEDVAAVNAAKPDYAGFVLAKSRRRISREHARLLRMELDPSIRAVGVFVNELPQIVAGYLEDGIIDIVQLHGQEDETYLRRLRFLTGEPVIQAFSVESAADLEKAEQSSADLILLDHGSGGTGGKFAWELLESVRRHYLLAGGITPDNVEEAVQRYHPFGIDVSSGVETGLLQAKCPFSIIAPVTRLSLLSYHLIHLANGTKKCVPFLAVRIKLARYVILLRRKLKMPFLNSPGNKKRRPDG